MTALSPAGKLRIAFELHETGRRMYRQTLKRRYPGLSEAQLDAAVLKWLLAPGSGSASGVPGVHGSVSSGPGDLDEVRVLAAAGEDEVEAEVGAVGGEYGVDAERGAAGGDLHEQVVGVLVGFGEAAPTVDGEHEVARDVAPAR